VSNAGPGLTLHSIERRLSLAALVAVAAIAWAFLVVSESAMTSMRGDGMVMQLMWLMMAPATVAPYLGAAALMWIIMMVAMMVPAVLPMAAVYRGIHRGAHTHLDTCLFAAGYFLGWTVFSLAAAGLQWWLHVSGMLHGHLLEAGPRTAAILLIVAGLYQLTPFKEACLTRCRSPVSFFMEHWSEGHAGAVVMGLRHGLFCIGCCWMLMLLMFAGGAMSVATMAALSVFILLERILPNGPWVSRLPGLALIVAGAALAVAS
jgi:predicted metal-binding membrane protein